MSELRRRTLSELATIVTGSTPSAAESDSWGDEIDFITPSDQRDDAREATPVRKLSALGASRLAKRVVPARSTNLTCIGSTIGKVTMASSPSVTNQQINSIVARPEIADSDFIYYLIKDWSRALKDHASGSATPIVNKTVLSRFEFLVPELRDQQAIGEVLRSIDDKIAANDKLIATSDTLRRTLFHSILIEDSREVTLSDTAEFINGKAFTKNASGTGRVVIRIAELNSGIGESTVFSDIDVDERHEARPGDILFAWSGSLTLHRWYREAAIINQHIFKVVPKVGWPSWLVYELIQHRLEEFRSIAAGKATTMGHIQRRDLDKPVRVPRATGIEAKDGVMASLWKRSLTAEIESLTLARTRDALLPQLMSGKLRVKDAEKVLEGAGV